ncbi:MAG: ParB/Srx family N-terminal domain-containing protein [Gammaproteobacteria bacterium]|nr:ParB/Srx family N-terminal domain-containing protein [Gammaproteobacteria bacterium]
MKIKNIKTSDLIPYANNSRTHDDAQVAQIAASIKEFGFTNPLLIDSDNGIIAGHGRLLAAVKLGMDEVPTIELSNLTKAQKKAYVIADNKLALNAGWDFDMLRIEIEDLKEMDFDIDLLGFDDSELIDIDGDIPEEQDPRDSVEDKEGFALIIEFNAEHDQMEVFNEMTRRGYECKPIS